MLRQLLFSVLLLNLIVMPDLFAQSGSEADKTILLENQSPEVMLAAMSCDSFEAYIEVYSPILCPGESTGQLVVYTKNESSPFVNYSWSTGEGNALITNLSAGTYSVTVSDSQCGDATATFELTEDEALAVNLNATPLSEEGAADGTIEAVFSGGVPPYTFEWDNGETSEQLSGLAAGSYTIEVTDSAGCTVERTVNMDVTLSAWTIDHAITFSVYPNPANDFVYIELDDFSHEYSVSIVNLLGKTVMTQNSSLSISGNFKLNIEGISSGIYLIHLMNDKGESGIKKLVVR